MQNGYSRLQALPPHKAEKGKQMSIEVKAHHPVVEKVARLLFGIDGVPPKEAKAMANRVIEYLIEEMSHDKTEAERERCAKIAESLYNKTYWDDPAAGIAAVIRRGGVK